MPQKTGQDGGRAPSMAEIARALGLSRQAVHTLHRRGMPVHSVEAAHTWRLEHLDPGRRKPGAFDDEMRVRERLALAESLMTAAGEALQRGNEPAFEALMPPLRQAMSEVPEAARDRLMLDVAVIDRLVSPVLQCIEACQAEDHAEALAAGLPSPDLGRNETETEVAQMGAFWYSVAAGEGLAAAFRHLGVREAC